MKIPDTTDSSATNSSEQPPTARLAASYSKPLIVLGFFGIALYPMWGIPIGAFGYLLYTIRMAILFFLAGMILPTLFFYLNSAQNRNGATRKSNLIFLIAALLAIFPSFSISLEASRRAHTSQALADMRVVAVSIETYNRRHNKYPISLSNLTTPISYLQNTPVDWFAPEKGAGFEYYASQGSWILWSAGINRRYELTSDNIRQVWNPKPLTTEEATAQTAVSLEAEPFISSPHLADYTWDSTNGTMSRGDIWRIKDTRNQSD